MELVRTNEKASVKLELIAMVDSKLSESCEIRTDGEQSLFFYGVLESNSYTPSRSQSETLYTGLLNRIIPF